MIKDYVVFDIETNGLYDEVTLIHCLCAKIYKDGKLIKIITITNYEEMKSFLASASVLIGHNIIRYDIPVLEKILDIKIKARLIDTLGISWYLYPLREKHGLEIWGDEYGVEKPKIADWSNLTIEEYVHRCTEDVKINTLIWEDFYSYLLELYEGEVDRILGYISYKLDCALEQEMVKWRVDVDLCEDTKAKLLPQKDIKIENLSKAMPLDIKYRKASKPKVMYKKDGNLSENGKKWVGILNENNLPLDYEGEVKVPTGSKPANPGSTTQMKNWLFSLGWKPCTYDYKKNKDTGEQREIPQVYDDKGVTPSVQLLYEKVPILRELEGLTIIKHRLGIIEGFLNNRDENNFLKAEVKGFTNTMRFQHTTIVNLPTIHKPYGKEIRGSLIAPTEGWLLCGSDMASLEDNTKQHYMYFYDPDYVREMRVPGFDPHLDIAVQGKMLTPEQVQLHKEGKEDHSKVRKDAKVVNFSAVYGVGAPKMSLTTGWPIEKSTQLLEVYWQRNWSVKTIAKNTKHKTVRGQMWLWNPVSHFWYSLRYLKDKFSTLNQGTGVYCFDTWIRNVRKRGLKICGQFHDEIIIPLIAEDEQKVRKILKEAIDETNKELKLNVELGISIDFGVNYAEIH